MLLGKGFVGGGSRGRCTGGQKHRRSHLRYRGLAAHRPKSQGRRCNHGTRKMHEVLVLQWAIMYFCTLERSTLLALMHIAFATNRYATSLLQRRTARLKEYTDWNPRAFQAQRRLGLRGSAKPQPSNPPRHPHRRTATMSSAPRCDSTFPTKPDRRQLGSTLCGRPRLSRQSCIMFRA